MDSECYRQSWLGAASWHGTLRRVALERGSVTAGRVRFVLSEEPTLQPDGRCHNRQNHVDMVRFAMSHRVPPRGWEKRFLLASPSYRTCFLSASFTAPGSPVGCRCPYLLARRC